LDFFYRKYGKGKPIIILHGLYGSSDNWIPIAKELSDNFEIFVIDQRNHGRSPHFDEHNYKLLCNDLYDFILDKNIIKPTILGHSMGGKTAMFFANKYPEIVKNLIIVDISPFSYKNLINKSELTLSHLNIINTLYNIDLERAKSIIDIKNQIRKNIKEERLINFLVKNIKHNSNKTYSWKFNLKTLRNELPNILDGFEKNSSLNSNIKINIPCLFIKGKDSNYISNEDKIDIMDVFTESQIISIPNSGHWVHAEQKEKFVELVRNYLLTAN